MPDVIWANRAESTEVIARAVVLIDRHLLVARLRGDRWAFLPGGHAEAGEPLHAALRREVAEELGARVVAADPIGTTEYCYVDDEGSAHHEINHVFLTATEGLPGPGQAVLSREESLEFHWTPLGRLRGEPLRPEPLKQALRHWIENGISFNITHAVGDW